jgi:hypothetical protein
MINDYEFLWYVLYTRCVGNEIPVMCVHNTHLPYLCGHCLKSVVGGCWNVSFCKGK